MCLMEVRPTAATVSLIAFYFDQLGREAIKVICIERVTHDRSSLKMKLRAANNCTFKPAVHHSFYRYGRPHRLTELRYAGGGHAE
jgi:hypothetical protein